MLQKSKQCGIHIKADTQRESSSQTDPNIHSQLISDKYAQSIQWRKDSLVTNGPGTTADPCVKTHFKSYLTSITKWTQNANTKHSTIKLLKSNTANYLDLELKISQIQYQKHDPSEQKMIN